jgi:uncharacterized lipoprotein YajG
MIAGKSYLAIAGMMLLTACAGPAGDVLVNIPRHEPLKGASALERVAPTNVEVGEFRESIGTGVLPGRIGERKTVGDISLGMVTIDPPPGRLVREAFTTELEAAGHRLASSDAAALVEGEVDQFELRTDVTALYWDVIVNGAVSTTVRTDTGEQTSHYSTTCTERTYAWPGDDLIARVISDCVNDLSDQFRNDESIAQLLAGKS